MQEINFRSRARGIAQAALVGFQLFAVTPLPSMRIGAAALTIPSGTDIPITVDQNIAVKQDQIGKTFRAHVTRNVLVNGAVAIPSGAPAEVALVESNDTPGAASFRLQRVSIGGSMRSVRTDVAHADQTKSGMSTGKKTGIGAAAGAVIGLVTGGGGGLLKGAAVGAGGGLAWGLLSKGSNEVKANTPLAFALSSAVRVP
jgi:hypothetical protein